MKEEKRSRMKVYVPEENGEQEEGRRKKEEVGEKMKI